MITKQPGFFLGVMYMPADVLGPASLIFGFGPWTIVLEFGG